MAFKKGEPNKEQVTVDLDYIVFLHDFLRLNLQKQRDILGESSSNAVYDYSADHLVKELGKGKRAPADVEQVASLLRNWGFRPSKKEDGASVTMEWFCPIASAVHPKLSPSEVGCPLGELVLGTVRAKHPMAQLESNQLTSSGAAVKVRMKEASRDESKA